MQNSMLTINIFLLIKKENAKIWHCFFYLLLCYNLENYEETDHIAGQPFIVVHL